MERVMFNTTMEALVEASPVMRREVEGPTHKRGPAPKDGWQRIVDRRFDNMMVREGLVQRPNERVCTTCNTVVTPIGTCMPGCPQDPS
jgi:hypothetical protein